MMEFVKTIEIEELIYIHKEQFGCSYGQLRSQLRIFYQGKCRKLYLLRFNKLVGISHTTLKPRKFISHGIEDQTEQVLKNMDEILKASSVSYSAIVKTAIMKLLDNGYRITIVVLSMVRWKPKSYATVSGTKPYSQKLEAASLVNILGIIYYIRFTRFCKFNHGFYWCFCLQLRTSGSILTIPPPIYV